MTAKKKIRTTKPEKIKKSHAKYYYGVLLIGN